MDSDCGKAATDLRFFAEKGKGTRELSSDKEALPGVAPRLSGVAGGRSLSNCSGLRTGPNETLLERLFCSLLDFGLITC